MPLISPLMPVPQEPISPTTIEQPQHIDPWCILVVVDPIKVLPSPNFAKFDSCL